MPEYAHAGLHGQGLQAGALLPHLEDPCRPSPRAVGHRRLLGPLRLASGRRQVDLLHQRRRHLREAQDPRDRLRSRRRGPGPRPQRGHPRRRPGEGLGLLRRPSYSLERGDSPRGYHRESARELELPLPELRRGVPHRAGALSLRFLLVGKQARDAPGRRPRVRHSTGPPLGAPASRGAIPLPIEERVLSSHSRRRHAALGAGAAARRAGLPRPLAEGRHLRALGLLQGPRLVPRGRLRAQARHIAEVALASTGNAASSMACVGAAAGLKVTVFLPKSAPVAKRIQVLQYGAELRRDRRQLRPAPSTPVSTIPAGRASCPAIPPTIPSPSRARRRPPSSWRGI